MGWLIPSEICALEVRSAGQAPSVSVNMVCTFFPSQTFLALLCHLKFGFFFFFGAFVIFMTYFIILFLPETKTIPIEGITIIRKDHWCWGKYSADDTLDHCEGNNRRPYFSLSNQAFQTGSTRHPRPTGRPMANQN
ncbi:sugar transport protein 4-like [Durio zibethinus]|uniref:Sugar transport protein 4-like n=1 Tax=Durio zibethinus TaxID=66656 RepID=A0A6P5XFX7_DURZI|nr:sugar transport protein 4-like [Durio zibethinus]